MYKILYGEKEQGALSLFASCESDVQACAMALDIHRLSNTPHIVKVYCDSEDSPLYPYPGTLLALIRDGE